VRWAWEGLEVGYGTVYKGGWRRVVVDMRVLGYTVRGRVGYGTLLLLSLSALIL
jgi:hypothetical protein